jgi:hypothetical protein
MKKNLVNRFLMLLLLTCLAVSPVLAQATKPVMKVTIPGYPTFICTDNTMMPLGATGGVVTIVKNADNLDQQFNQAMKNKTPLASLDLVYYNSVNGQLSKTKSFHFTTLIVKSLIPNFNKVTAIGFSFENMTNN